MSAATICRASRVVLTATGSCAHALRWHSGAGNTDDRAAPHTALRVPRVDYGDFAVSHGPIRF